MNQPISLQSIPSSLRGIRIVDADTHISEWDDLWTSRSPVKYKDRVPQKKLLDGKRIWMIDGDKSLGTGSPIAAIRKDGSKSSGYEFLDWELEDAHPGAYDVKERVKFMDETGIYAQIAYPNLLGFGGQRNAMVDPELRLVCAKIYNDAMAQMQADSGDRIFPMALLPWWDVKESVAEAKRCHRMGLRGVNINSDPQTHGLPNLGHPHWDPLWETCVECDLPVNFHIGASEESVSFSTTGYWAETGSNTQLAYGSVMLFIGNCRTLTNILLSLFLERFPTLKIVSVESGVGWLPFMLEAVEYEMQETGIKYKVPPFEIFKRQIYGCSWFERRNFVANTRALGVNNIMFETDFPHPTCLYPDALNYIAEAAGEFTPEERTQVFGGNAARIYNIPAPK
jgi:predicted TIM-barrel fold metal-dependent hydrolase